jgi:hypothetical protein
MSPTGSAVEDWGPYGVPIEVAAAFIESLTEHITYVVEAGERIGVSKDQLDVHDLSKWSIHEFPGYALHFKGGGAPDLFVHAWLHHIHYNPHHWQHWIFADRFTPKGSRVEGGCVEMPKIYVVEMVADWMGASRAYTGSWDMSNWLGENLPKIQLHSNSWIVLKEILRKSEYGYHNILNELQVNGLIP